MYCYRSGGKSIMETAVRMRRSRRYILRMLVLAFVACTILADDGCGGGVGSVIPPFSFYSSVAVGDLNGDGKPDIATCFAFVAGAPPHPGSVAVYLQDPAHPGTFLPPATYSVGNDPEWIAIGDLNGDGKLDIVTANSILNANGLGSSNVSVLLQDPARPGQFLAATDFATGKVPVSVAIGDLNGDGKPDLAVADTSGISLLFQDPSHPGSFLSATTLSVGSAASSVAIGDLDGDQKPDLVATTEAGVAVLLQNTTMPGTFSTPTTYGAGLQPSGVAIADLDRDGKPDLAVANRSPNGGTGSVSVLLQNSAAPGTFLAATNYNTGILSSVVAIADLNGDGRADLAVANNVSRGSFDGSLSVLLQDPASPGHFQATTNYPGTDQVLSVVAADMNGDNRPDLVIAQSGGIVIRFQDRANPGAFLPITVITK